MTRFVDFLYPVTGGTTSRKEPDRWLDYGINVKEFGAVGDNIHDDTANIQAAIDYAFNNTIGNVYVPQGTYKISSSIYIDPPGNLRSSLANPTNFSFSMNFHGESSLGSNTQRGATFYPVTNDFVAFYVGPGQGMRVANFSVIGPATSYRGNQSALGVGVGTTGCGGGLSRCLIEGVYVENFHTGFQTSANGNGTLGDSNTLIECMATNAYFGLELAGTQNFINLAIGCSFNATVALSALPGVGCTVIGGNYSAGGCVSGSFAISAISAVTATPTGNVFDYTFSATIAAPDIYVGASYNAYAIVTAHMGVIPLLLTAYNSGTHVGTFKALDAYAYFNWSVNNAVANADLQAEIQACATLYAAEQVTVFQGSGITVKGIHIENNAPTKLFHAEEQVGQGRLNDCDNIFFNQDPSLSIYRPSAGPTAALLARYYIAMTFPFIWIKNASLHIEDSSFTMQPTSDPVPIDFEDEGAYIHSFSLERCAGYRFNTRTGENGGFNAELVNSANFGSGEYDLSPFTVGDTRPTTLGSKWRLNAGRAPQWGVRPAPYSRPAIFVTDLATLTGALPAITYTAALRGGIGSSFGTTLTSGGAGYTAGDVLTMVGGTFTTAAQITVFTVAAGVITAWYTSTAGSYTVAPASFTVAGGTGAGATFGSPQWFTSNLVDYPLIWGGQQYALYSYFVGNQPAGYSCVSDHHFYTYGQNFTTTNVPQLAWSYKGQSFAVYVNDMNLLFPGLGVTLNDGVSDVLYIITGIYPGLGYFTVSATGGATDAARLSGLKTSVITGTTIKQEAFSITQF